MIGNSSKKLAEAALKSFIWMLMHDGLRIKTLWLVPTCDVEFASLSLTTANTQHTHTQTHKHSVAFLQLLQEVSVIYF